MINKDGNTVIERIDPYPAFTQLAQDIVDQGKLGLHNLQLLLIHMLDGDTYLSLSTLLGQSGLDFNDSVYVIVDERAEKEYNLLKSASAWSKRVTHEGRQKICLFLRGSPSVDTRAEVVHELMHGITDPVAERIGVCRSPVFDSSGENINTPKYQNSSLQITLWEDMMREGLPDILSPLDLGIDVEDLKEYTAKFYLNNSVLNTILEITSMGEKRQLHGDLPVKLWKIITIGISAEQIRCFGNSVDLATLYLLPEELNKNITEQQELFARLMSMGIMEFLDVYSLTDSDRKWLLSLRSSI